MGCQLAGFHIINFDAICATSFDPFYIERKKTSWTYSRFQYSSIEFQPLALEKKPDPDPVQILDLFILS